MTLEELLAPDNIAHSWTKAHALAWDKDKRILEFPEALRVKDLFCHTPLHILALQKILFASDLANLYPFFVKTKKANYRVTLDDIEYLLSLSNAEKFLEEMTE